MKRLIDISCVNGLIDEGKKTLYADGYLLITPAARDLMKARGIEIAGCQEGKKEAVSQAGACRAAAETGDLDPALLFSVFSKLQKAGLFADAPCGAGDTPYVSDKDKSGLKVVRGHSVVTTTLETGNPADNGKVQYQELISASDLSPMNAGFMTIDACAFDWDVLVHEIYYIVSGRICITIGEKTYSANPGDCIYIPKGIKCRFAAEKSVKVFYATY